MAKARVEREKRFIFLESENQYFKDINESILYNYAEQMSQAFPTSKKQISNILAMEKPHKITKEQ